MVRHHHRGATNRSAAKTAELFLRSLWNTYRYSRRVPLRVTAPTDVLQQHSAHTSRVLRIVFLRQDRIGDVLIATPVIREVRKRYPDARIDMVLSRNNIAVQRAIAPYTDNVHVYEKSLVSLFRLWKTLRRRRYDVVIDLLDNASATSGLLIEATAAPIRIGIDKDNTGVYSHVVPLLDQSLIPINRRVAQLLLSCGIDPGDVDLRPEYPVTTSELDAARQSIGAVDQSCALGVVLSGSLSFKRYSPENFCAVLRMIKTRLPWLKVFIFGGPDEQHVVRFVAEQTGSRAVPSSSFHQYACQLRAMDAVLTPDTAAVHLAAAWRTPCVVLYVPDGHGRLPWYPWDTPHEALISDTDHVNDIPPERVVEAVQRLFAYCGLNQELP